MAGDGTLQDRLRERAAEGAPGNLGLERVAKRIAHERRIWSEREAALVQAIEALVEDETDPARQGAAGEVNSDQQPTGDWARDGGFNKQRALVLGI